MSTAKKLYETASQIDSDQRNHLLMEQLPQVRYIAKRIHDRLPQHVALEDLVHAGVIGLIDALHKYDPAKNVQIKSYAKFRIRSAIMLTAPATGLMLEASSTPWRTLESTACCAAPAGAM